MAVLIANCSAVLAWLSSFIGRLVRVAPLQVPASILASLCSQVFQIVAFLLPLKVMILLGSHGVPGYFPRFLEGIERERLILLLSVAAALLYMMHLLMDFIGATFARAGSDRLIVQRQEGEALTKQQKIALSCYRGVITIAGGSIFALGVLSFLGWSNGQLLAVVLGYFASCFLLAELVFTWRPALLEKAIAQFPRLIDVLSACGFLLVFGFLVRSFLYGEAKGLLMGILILLLCRQMFSRLAMALKSIERLYGQRERALLVLGGQQIGVFDEEEDGDESFRDPLERTDEFAAGPVGLLDGGGGEALLRRREQGQPDFWGVVAPEHCVTWVREVLSAAGVTTREMHIEQLDGGRKGELTLHLACAGAGQSAEHFLFKAFNRQETKRVNRAATLLTLYPGQAAVRLRAVIERDGFAAHLYDWAEQASPLDNVQVVYACREQAFIESCAWQVPEALVVTCQPGSLVERCSPALWARCQVFSRWLDADIRESVDAFAAVPFRLQSALGELPLRLYNPDITLGNTYVLKDSLKALRWESWTLEPIGSGWPLELGLERLDQVFAHARESSEELHALSALQVRLAALAFAFEERCAQWAYLSAFALLGELRDTLDALEC
ncbi:hypothetical protein [Aquipseudomonas guryensis]|uniref:Uncharacterized protein n=1 Tax=Aquipseudomonas guryensis TaxID=2759165 RepID=A0A7W4DAA7_9GAMM|nr:hypothetical protein [Pseudomonas guryensis]MBB1518926.1 hypothetical protein [Pseudomonas guryensis]